MIKLSGQLGEVRLDPEKVERLLEQLHFIRFYDAAPAGDPHSVGPADWAMPALLSAPVGYEALKAITDQDDYVPKLDAALAAVDKDWRLEDEDADGYRRRTVRSLMSAMCSVDGVSKAIATKILHKKRPYLIPIVDKVVFEFYAQPSMMPTDVMFDQIRTDLLANKRELVELADEASRFASPGQVTPLRMLEMIVWMHARKVPYAIAV